MKGATSTHRTVKFPASSPWFHVRFKSTGMTGHAKSGFSRDEEDLSTTFPHFFYIRIGRGTHSSPLSVCEMPFLFSKQDVPHTLGGAIRYQPRRP